MYNSQNIASRIKATAKSRGKPLGTVLSECGLGKNTISKIGNGTDILTLNFAKIADCLNCSVDYLLGRTDEPSPTSNVIGGDVNGGAVVQGSHYNNVTVSNGERKLTDEENELLRLFNSLDVKHRVKLLNFGFSLEDENKWKKE